MSLAELQDAMRCKISGKYFLDPVIICISNHPKLLVGESYDRESVKELLEKEPREVVFQSNPSVQKFVTTLINRGVDRLFEERPKKKLSLPQDVVDKVKTFLPPPRPPGVILFKPKNMQILFREGVLEGDDLEFFKQSLKIMHAIIDLNGWKTVNRVNIFVNCDFVDRCIALGFRFREGGREAYHANANFEMYR